VVELTRGLLGPVDRVFNRLFGAEYNPLYRSGTIAMGLLTIATVTGLYLIFFYRLGQPYESVIGLNSQVWLGRWVRAAHRYSADACVVAVVVHVLRMIAQGKTWGPRTLAWLSGVVLVVFLFTSGWTGYVLVWDVHGQSLASAGATIIDSLGILPEPVKRSFDGVASQPPPSFFFLNLFMHVVVPLSMIFGVWLHTSRIARAVWLPHRKLMVAMSGLVILVSVLWPAPLPEKANLLRITGRIPIDWFYGFWLPLAEGSPRLVLLLWVLGILILLSVPFWLKPRPRPEPSFNDPKACQGCRQCAVDCPYEAIQMIPRLEGFGSAEVAKVDTSLCVSCGICAGSCSSFTMGPQARKASDQFARAKNWIDGLAADEARRTEWTALVACKNQRSTLDRVEAFATSRDGFHAYEVECAGTVHAAVFELLAKTFKGVAIVACPGRDCTNKDGFLLASERLSGKRTPTLSKRLDPSRIKLFAVGPGEEDAFFQEFSQIVKPSRWWSAWVAQIAGAVLFFAIAFVSGLPSGQHAQEGILRLSWRLPGQATKNCRPLTPHELAQTPAHMRMNEICKREQLTYRLRLELDGNLVSDEQIMPGGFNRDRPLYVGRDIPLSKGSHSVLINFDPVAGDGLRFRYENEVKVREGGVSLIHLTSDLRELVLKEEP
jgi:ferredoxin